MKACLLEGKTAIVTGGSKGIGQAIADMFVAEGANVVITARGQEALDQTTSEISGKGYPGKIMGMTADSSKEEDAERVFAKTLEKFGDLDIMVNNAGISNRFSLECTTDDEWNSLIATNLTGPMYYIRLALRHMLEKKKGSIITVSSAMGIRCAGGAGYVSSKAGVIGLTKNIAFRGVEDGIRANCICPGHVETPMAMAVKDQLKTDSRTAMSQFTNAYANRQEKLYVDAEQIAYAALYLASDMSKSVTGQCLTVDAGMFMPF